jgi:hypothetical protein
MRSHHVLMLVIVAFVGYVLGVKYPGWGRSLPGMG